MFNIIVHPTRSGVYKIYSVDSTPVLLAYLDTNNATLVIDYTIENKNKELLLRRDLFESKILDFYYVIIFRNKNRYETTRNFILRNGKKELGVLKINSHRLALASSIIADVVAQEVQLDLFDISTLQILDHRPKLFKILLNGGKSGRD